jgi:hypothetical protein
MPLAGERRFAAAVTSVSPPRSVGQRLHPHVEHLEEEAGLKPSLKLAKGLPGGSVGYNRSAIWSDS